MKYKSLKEDPRKLGIICSVCGVFISDTKYSKRQAEVKTREFVEYEGEIYIAKRKQLDDCIVVKEHLGVPCSCNNTECIKIFNRRKNARRTHHERKRKDKHN